MRNPPDETPEAASIRNWVGSVVIADEGYDLSQLGDVSILYALDRDSGYLTAQLDGLSVTRPAWAGQTRPASHVLYEALGAHLEATPSHLVQLLCHDGAWWELRSVTPVTSGPRHLPWVLGLVHREPAEEGGHVVIMLLADDRQSAVVLVNSPCYPPHVYPQGFSIAFHGRDESRALFLRRLETAADSQDEVLG
ncbi:hypothetical protein JIN84_09330 [Luteolibacter yonseiensis]|uniref:Uncharacterized protein n=1 Tax=Luteolibacter yonseiensis TaxID=1144680 RepID=A0A934R4D4_9BACT|nr:hypothetical protein [Luteolibacter yonseiensis]MBK1815818.1 hypothetical protein [Luteolibacter yonseiensis]